MSMYGTPDLVPKSTKTRWNNEGNAFRSERLYRTYWDVNDSDIYVLNHLPSGLAPRTSDPGYAGFVATDVEVSDGEKCTYSDGVTLVREWMVGVQYGPWTSLFNASDGNPINQPPMAAIESTESTIPAIVDTDGQPIVNTVGDPYDPTIERPKTVVAVIVYMNLKNPNIVDMLTNWVDHINLTQWQVFPARTLLVAPISLPKPEYYQDGGFAFYPMEFRLLFNPDTWDKTVLNQGYRAYDKTQTSTGTDLSGNPAYPLMNIKIEGEPAQEPVLLSASGDYLMPPVNKTDVVFNKHKILGTVEFSNFPFTNVVIPTGT